MIPTGQVRSHEPRNEDDNPLVLVGVLALSLGFHDISIRGGCWACEFGEWSVWVNPHPDPCPANDTDKRTILVPSMAMHVEFMGKSAGTLGAYGGAFIDTEIANVQIFIRSIKAAIAVASACIEKT